VVVDAPPPVAVVVAAFTFLMLLGAEEDEVDRRPMMVDVIDGQREAETDDGDDVFEQWRAYARMSCRRDVCCML